MFSLMTLMPEPLCSRAMYSSPERRDLTRSQTRSSSSTRLVADKKFRVQRFRGVHRYRPQHESHFSESREYLPIDVKMFRLLTSTICKHIIGLAHLNKLHQIPSQCKAVPIGQKKAAAAAADDEEPVVVAKPVAVLRKSERKRKDEPSTSGSALAYASKKRRV
ncbi:unnamed protein product [Sphagnum balticum]